jgi:DNA-binding CsgD family transcriptional regulator
MGSRPRRANAQPGPEVHLRIVEFAYAYGLSVREGAIVLLAAGFGLHRKETAHRLSCSPGTIDTYWRRILHKTGHDSQLALMASLLGFALTRPDGWIDDPELSRRGIGVPAFERYRSKLQAVVGCR